MKKGEKKSVTTLSIFVAIAVTLSFLLGIAYSYWYTSKHTDGQFIVNLNNPEEDMFKMVIDVPLEDIPSKNYLIFKIHKA